MMRYAIPLTAIVEPLRSNSFFGAFLISLTKGELKTMGQYI
jgi:hypothetical protein